MLKNKHSCIKIYTCIHLYWEHWFSSVFSSLSKAKREHGEEAVICNRNRAWSVLKGRHFIL